MYSKNRWYYFDDVIDKSTCNRIINLAKEKWQKAEVKGQNKQKEEQQIRTSEVAWVINQWLYDTIWPCMQKANAEAGWKYDIQSAEDMQVTRYKEGDYFNLHKDGMNDHFSVYTENNPIIKDRVRKLSMTVLLNDDYEGGEFQFATYSKQKSIIETPKVNSRGSIIVFPSDVEHRVTPVTKGIRYSLVAWFLGPPFK